FARIKGLNEQKKPFHLVLNDATIQIPPEALGNGGLRFTVWEINIRDITNATSVSISGPGVREVGRFAFRGCMVLKKVSFPVAKRIASYAFESCPFLESVYLPSVRTVEEAALCMNRSLRYVSFPAATIIGRSAFFCLGISNMIYNNGPRIPPPPGRGPHPWSHLPLTSLTSVLLPAVEEIEEDAFMYCTRLRLLQFPKIPPAIGREGIFENVTTDKLLFLVPDPSKYVSLPTIRRTARS
ncbi:MAG: leucine-rich repeat domain-containing protein, partial [Synergistaceae bacterium]|nr:leucine-rich repeat domain-containing protein [Synergistaceae bacterium]